MQVGTITTISIATAILADSDNAAAQAWTYGAAPVLLFVAMPLITRGPKHRGNLATSPAT